MLPKDRRPDSPITWQCRRYSGYRRHRRLRAELKVVMAGTYIVMWRAEVGQLGTWVPPARAAPTVHQLPVIVQTPESGDA